MLALCTLSLFMPHTSEHTRTAYIIIYALLWAFDILVCICVSPAYPLSFSLSLSLSLCLSPSCAFAIWTCQFVLLCCVVPQTCAHCFPLNAVIKVSLHPFCKLMGIYLPTAGFMHLQNPIKFETSWN